MTKEIVCLSGEIILVDDEDYPVLSRHRWRYRHSARGICYAATQMNIGDHKDWRTIFMHNMILGFAFYVDHHDGDTKNNQKGNLRPATMQLNGWNSRKQKTVRGLPCSSQYKGVRRVESKTKGTRWLASLKHVEEGAHKSTGRMIYIGYFDTEIGAAKAYNKKVRELRGEWAWINPLPGEAA